MLATDYLSQRKFTFKRLRFIFKIFHRVSYLFQIPFYFFKLKKIFNKRGNKKVIAISLTRRLGDIISTEPILRTIRKKNPKAFIIWFTEKDYVELLQTNPNINLVFQIKCLSVWIFFRKYFNFDLICDFHFEGRKCCSYPLLKSEGDKTINHLNYYDYGNLLDIYSLTSGILPIYRKPLLYIGQSNIDIVDKLKLPKKFISIHLESKSSKRKWELNKWISLVRFINKKFSLPVVEVGSESQLSMNDKSNHWNLCGVLSILSSAEVIRRSIFFIGVDSGPAHIANAVSTYGIILMGDYYHFKNYQPFSGEYFNGNMATIVRTKGNVKNLPLQRVKSCVIDVSEKIIKKS